MNQAASGVAKLKRTLRIMFLVVEINLILWIVMWGMADRSEESMKSVNTMALVGFAFAAIVQHWAYYAVYKKAKQMEPHKWVGRGLT